MHETSLLYLFKGALAVEPRATDGMERKVHRILVFICAVQQYLYPEKTLVRICLYFINSAGLVFFVQYKLHSDSAVIWDKIN